MSLGVRQNFPRIKFAKNFSQISSKSPIPYVWNIVDDLENIFVYLDSIIKDQIIFDGFSAKSIEFLDLRAKIVNQMIQICQNFRLKNETLYKTVQIFDLFCWKISNFRSFSFKNNYGGETDNINKDENKNTIDQANRNSTNSYLRDMLKELKIIIVLCLNIACKLEEINCNYIIYFKENLLDDEEKNDFFDLKELVKRETEILKIINFKVATPSFYVFNNVYMQLLNMEIFRTSNKLDFEEIQNIITHLVKVNDTILKVYCTLHESVYISPLYSGLICIKATLLQFEDLYLSNLSNLKKYLSNLIYSSSYMMDSEFVDLVSARLFSLIKSKKIK
jgi:hypothetical protein